MPGRVGTTHHIWNILRQRTTTTTATTTTTKTGVYSSVQRGIPVMACAVHEEKNKVRVLCLHGYMQDGTLFRNKIGSLRKAMKRHAEFFFVDAPFVVNGEEEERQGRSWWEWKNACRPSRSAEYHGWDVSQNVISQAIHEHGPIDVILGFSQGATAAALYALTGSCKVNNIVVISGFLPRDPVYADNIQNAPEERKQAVRGFFVSGEKDERVSLEQSELLWKCFPKEQSTILVHQGGHFVPTRACTKQLAEFLQTV